MHDCVEFEKMGIPTVHITARPFFHADEASRRVYGLPAMPNVIVERLISDADPEDVPGLVLPVVDQIVEALTRPIVVAEPGGGPEQEVLEFDGPYPEAFERFNRTLLEHGWGDGFPAIPPTPEAVDRMLEGTSRSPNEVVALLAPGNGLATVRKIAVNCVMAGCRLEHLPVVIAATEAMASPAFNLPFVANSTSPHTPVLVVNGPIRKEIGINCGLGALGPGSQSWVNSVIGRAVRLVLMNIGRAYPGKTDMDTIGSPIKYSACLGENEEASPWEPLHVERGFRPDASCVTVFSVDSLANVANFNCFRPEEILTTWAYTGNTAGSGANHYHRRVFHNLCLFPPDHVKVFGEAGWSKDDVRRYLHLNSRLPWGVIRLTAERERIPAGLHWLYGLPDNELVPVTRDARLYHPVVVGHAVGKGLYGPGGGAPVTREIGR